MPQSTKKKAGRLRVAISPGSEKSIAVLVRKVVESAVHPDAPPETCSLCLDEAAFVAIAAKGIDLFVIVLNPHWPELKPGGGNTSNDLKKLRRLRNLTTASIVAIHNGFGGHGEPDLQHAGATLVLTLPIDLQSLRNFVVRYIATLSEGRQ